MAIPSQRYIELPLLLEMGRLGGYGKGRELYFRIALHFVDVKVAFQVKRFKLENAVGHRSCSNSKVALEHMNEEYL